MPGFSGTRYFSRDLKNRVKDRIPLFSRLSIDNSTMSKTEKHQPVDPVEADVFTSTPGMSDEAILFASPLPLTGERKTTTRKELWVGSSAC